VKLWSVEPSVGFGKQRGNVFKSKCSMAGTLTDEWQRKDRIKSLIHVKNYKLHRFGAETREHPYALGLSSLNLINKWEKLE